jgi:hypothetical protein
MIKQLLNRLKRVFAPAPSVPTCADKLTPEEWAEVVRYVAQQLNEKAMAEKPTAKSTKASTRKAPQKRNNVGQLVTELTNHLRAHYAFRYNVLTEQAEMARLDVPSVYYPVGKRIRTKYCNGYCVIRVNQKVTQQLKFRKCPIQ